MEFKDNEVIYYWLCQTIKIVQFYSADKCFKIFFPFILRTKNGDDIEEEENVEEVTKQPSVSSVKQLITKEDKVSKNKDTLLPRLVANGTQLVKSWEDQYYVVNEYRANAHQVGSISSKYPKGS